ncbi:MAG TPA: phage major capsid protein [Methanosarcinales archaeon]|nr:phage major capsid protein [Methanosarcinales archaeon]
MLVNLAEKRKELAEKIVEARGLNKVEMTEDEIAKYDIFTGTIENLRAYIEREEKSQALEMANPVIEDPQNDPNIPEVRGFKTLGEQLMAVVDASKTGATPDARLIESRALGLNEGIPSEGGFLVQKDFATGLMQRAYETGVLASRINKVPIGPNSNGLIINAIDESSRVEGSRFGAMQLYHLAEAGTKLASKPKFRQIELKLKKLIGVYYATDELLQDTTALDAVITQAFTSEFGFKIDDMIFRGSGVGQPLGYINSPAVVSVAKEALQPNDTIVFENVMKMWARLYAPSRPNAVWFINQEIEPQLFAMTMPVGLGGVPVYMPAGGLSGAPYATLFNRPVIAIEQASALGDLGDISVADLSQYIMIDKGGIQTASSIHVAFMTDEQVFRFVYRYDGLPWWNTPLTPYKAAAAGTLSPFVTLAVR